MHHFSATPREMIASLWRNRSLVRALIKREIQGRYRGSLIGVFWSFLNPLLMLAVYTFVFSVVFNARWDTTSDSKTEFALILFAGLIIFNVFAECINRAPGLILNNQNYVKKVVFPLEVLPWVTLGAGLFHGAVSLSVWLLAYMVFFGTPHITILYLPIVILPLVLFIMGLSWILASLGVYLRDVAQFVGITTTTLMFISPIFYPATALPEEYRALIYMNPLTIVIEQARDVLFRGSPPDVIMSSAYFTAAIITAWLGFILFQKTRKGFADVL
ncbi:ABC transporter permease [Pseudomonas sp. G.S.17]|uniref:ABC transporter permease n=1 Tax=Pseudomonas sp. G.S.17 TaxID=3137451 RepID=UPI00311CA25A